MEKKQNRYYDRVERKWRSMAGRFTRSRMKEWREVEPHQSQYPRKEKAMKTFVQTRSTLLETLAKLRRLEGTRQITQALRIVKERETGKLCYQAEEDLSPAELSLLRDMLEVQKSKWDTYKYKYCESLHTLLEGNYPYE